MDLHRLVSATSTTFLATEAPFSSFQHVEDNYQDLASVHRCFSLARSMGFKTLLTEEIPAAGIVAEENEDLVSWAKGHRAEALHRLSFWDIAIANMTDLEEAPDSSAIGYAVLKRDICQARGLDRWHVFEAVFRKYPHGHNCVPKPRLYRFRAGSREFSLPGVLYCQQNRLNKACAHVALRSLLSRRLADGDCSYRTMNKIAAEVSSEAFDPGSGLSVPQIRAILEHYGVPYRDIDYEETEKQDERIRVTHPFQKYVYGGIESGCGALLGFRLAGPKASDGKHIIPFYGHTFNKDTWVPDADIAYFNVGGGIGYIPSESWTSSFLGHDDNIGPNLCVPRIYARPEHVQYVVELLPDGYRFDGMAAEAIALQFLYSLDAKIRAYKKNPWMRRLAGITRRDVHRVVLRSIAVPGAAYLDWLSSAESWGEKRRENERILQVLKPLNSKALWVVEVSVPHLFPANERKLGEIVLNAEVPFDPNNLVDKNLFLLCRLPGRYFLIEAMQGGMPKFGDFPSELRSHTPLLRMDGATR